MGKRYTVELFDDLEPELAADETIRFTFDGVNYQIDLSSKNADRFRDEMMPWIRAATTTGDGASAADDDSAQSVSRKRASRPGDGTGLPLAEIRAWARANGHDVPARGRVAAGFVRAWKAATG
jgi:hypothetical protein